MQRKKAAVVDIEENDKIGYDIDVDMEENPAVNNLATFQEIRRVTFAGGATNVTISNSRFCLSITGSATNSSVSMSYDGDISECDSDSEANSHGSTCLEEIPVPDVIRGRNRQQTRVSNSLVQPPAENTPSRTTNTPMCTVINSNHTQSHLVVNTKTMDNSLNDTSSFTEQSELSDDEDEEAFLNGDRTDVWSETLEYYSDEEQSDTEFDTYDDNVEQEETDTKKCP